MPFTEVKSAKLIRNLGEVRRELFPFLYSQVARILPGPTASRDSSSYLRSKLYRVAESVHQRRIHRGVGGDFPRRVPKSPKAIYIC